jgi:hypothetical protein
VKAVVPAKMAAPEKVAARAQQSQKMQQRHSSSANKVGSKGGNASKGGSTSKVGSASKFGSTTGQASQARQGHVLPSIYPRHSKSTNKGMPPPPQHKDVERPPGEPPNHGALSPQWGVSLTSTVLSSTPLQKESLPAQANASTVGKQQSSRKHSTVSQSSETRAHTTTITQSTASMQSSRKRITAGQSSKTRAIPPRAHRAPHPCRTQGS